MSVKAATFLNNYEKCLKVQSKKITGIQKNLFKELSVSEELTIDSAVIKPEDPKAKEFLQLLKNCFSRPFKLTRIFRASEHDFKAAAFHERCDDLENTFMLVKTQFGKTIGGFTKYKWNAANQDYVKDKGK
jgi:hypothetical protein